MFKTIMMDIQPHQSTPAPAPAHAATSHAPALAPAVADAPVTAPPSAGPGSPHDGSPGDEGANGHGVARRPGNLWTAEDREDMFHRRERGEGWETICADYPNRSRHAMQQQYSMMKKQKALADGTWASNRRGRKRRNPGPERATPVKRAVEHYAPEMDENMTEVDENDEMPSEDPEDSDEAIGRGMANGRPNALMRSATEPAKATKSRQAAAYASNGVGTDASGTPVMNQSMESMPVQGFTSVNRGRKRRISADRGSNTNVTPPVESQPGAGNVVLNQEDILNLLRKGSDWARKSSRAIDEERGAQALAFEQSLSRANKRATDAQEKYSYASFEHGENMKKARIEFSETLKAKGREHKDAAQKLREDFDDQLRRQHSQVDAQARKNEELRREIELLKRDLPDREKEMDQEINRLRAEKAVLEEAKTAWESAAKAEPSSLGAASAPAASPPAADASAENLPGSYLAAEAELYRACQDLCADFGRSAGMIEKFHEEFEELGHKRTVQYLADIAAQTVRTSTLMAGFRRRFDAVHTDLAQAQRQPASQPQPPAPAAALPPPQVRVDPAVPSPPPVQVQAPPASAPPLSADAMDQDPPAPAPIKEEAAPVPSATEPQAPRGDVAMADRGPQP